MVRNPKNANYIDDLIGDETEPYCHDFFYHYTSSEGIKGILLCNNPITLWFSRAEFLNDAEEGKEIFDIIWRMLEENDNVAFCEWIKSIQYNTSASFITPRIVGSERTIENEAVSNRMDTYICSFSENGDSLPMWNYYSREGNDIGYNIGFFREALYRSIQLYCIDKEYLVPNIYKVIYNEEKKKEVLRKLLEDFEVLFQKSDENNDSLADLFNVLIQEMRYRFKNQHFSYEKEVRVTIRTPSTNEREGQPVQVRSKSGFLVPYIVIDDLKKNAIGTLHMGPSRFENCEKSLKVKVLSECLEKVGFTGISVEMSDIPLRY